MGTRDVFQILKFYSPAPYAILRTWKTSLMPIYHEMHSSVHKILYIFNNYSPKWRWLVVDIYRGAKWRGKYPTLATDTEVTSCFSIY